jgi:hypothetical protein
MHDLHRKGSSFSYTHSSFNSGNNFNIFLALPMTHMSNQEHIQSNHNEKPYNSKFPNTS